MFGKFVHHLAKDQKTNLLVQYGHIPQYCVHLEYRCEIPCTKEWCEKVDPSSTITSYDVFSITEASRVLGQLFPE